MVTNFNFIISNLLLCIILNCKRWVWLTGEWVNEWNVSNGSQADYQNFGRAQLEVYNAASFGWTYWTLKNDRKHWDFEWNIKNNYLQLGRWWTKNLKDCFSLSVFQLWLTNKHVRVIGRLLLFPVLQFAVALLLFSFHQSGKMSKWCRWFPQHDYFQQLLLVWIGMCLVLSSPVSALKNKSLSCSFSCSLQDLPSLFISFLFPGGRFKFFFSLSHVETDCHIRFNLVTVPFISSRKFSWYI